MVNKDLQRCYVLFAPLKINISLNGSKSLRWFLAEDKKRHDSLYTFCYLCLSSSLCLSLFYPLSVHCGL